MILFVINSFLCYSFAFLGIIIFLWFNVDKTSGLVSAVFYSLPFLIPIILFNLFAFRAEANGIERLGRHLFKKFIYLLLCVAIFVMILAVVEFGWCNSDMCGLITIMAIYGGIAILLFSLLTIFLTVLSKQFAGYKKLYPYLLLIVFGALVFSAVYFFSPGHCPFANENCIAAKALEKNNPQLCDKSKLPPFCYRLLALRTGETKYCEMIDGYEDKLVGSVHSELCYEQLREKTKSNEELQQGTVATKFADWKIYRNEEYGFELKYPEDKIVVDYRQKEAIHFWWKENYEFGGIGVRPGISVYVLPPAEANKEWIQRNLGLYVLQDKKEWFGGKEVFMAKGEKWQGGRQSIIASFEDKLLFIDFADNPTGFDYQIVKEILSTFTFILPAEADVAAPLEWETYKSAYFGFQFKYPSNWFLNENTQNVSTANPYGIVGLDTLPRGEARVLFDEISGRSITNLVAEFFGPATNNRIVSDSIVNFFTGGSGREIVYTCKDCEEKYIPEINVYISGKEGNAVFFSRNNDVLYFRLFYYKNDPRSDYYTSTFGQILSNLRFLDNKR